MGPSSGELPMNDSTQNSIREQIARIERAMEQHWAFTEAMHKRRMDQLKRSAKRLGPIRFQSGLLQPALSPA